MVRPKKYLGQHFLTDPSIARRIVDSLDPDPGDYVIEVGPGTGVLTGLLLDRNIRLVPIEIDPESVRHLLNKWPALKDSIVEGNFLDFELKSFTAERVHIIGNFPYNISSQIFFKIIGDRQQVSSVVCMLQKEVADRIVSPPGSRDYGILSVLVQAFFEAHRLFHVKPGSFHPSPRVMSGVIRLERNHTDTLSCDEELFFRVVKTVFNQRRKMIRNSIRSILLNLGSDFELLSKRPEQLDVQQFIDLTCWVKEQQVINRDRSS